MKDISSAFLIKVAKVESDYLPATVRSCEFSVDSYCDALFPHYRVYFPDSLLNAAKKRKAEYLASRILAKPILEEFGYPEYKLTSNHHRCPIWPTQLVGSIAHSNGVAICSVESSRKFSGIGVDVENVFDLDYCRRVQQQIYKNEEIFMLINSGLATTVAATLLFSAKESIFKALYPKVGKYFDFLAVRAANIDPSKQLIKIEIVEDLSETVKTHTMVFVYYTILDDYAITQALY